MKDFLILIIVACISVAGVCWLFDVSLEELRFEGEQLANRAKEHVQAEIHGTTNAPVIHPSSHETSASNVREVREIVFPGTVHIRVTSGLFCAVIYQGTGFIVDDYGYVGTAKHVAEHMGTVCGTTVTLYDGRVIGGTKKIWESPTADAAMIKMSKARAIDPIPLGSSRSLSVGDIVYTVSYPGGVKNPPVLSVGTVTRRGSCQGAPDGIWFDADAMPGYSGGPLVDSKGHVVGIVVGSYAGFWEGPGSCATPIEYLSR